MRSILPLFWCMLSFMCISTLQAQKQQLPKDTTVSFMVYGVCDQCKHRIEAAVKGKAVTAADWNVDTKMLTLTYEPGKINLEKINSRITAAGHDTYLKKASDADYNKLPSC